ncbi:hypothetical protein [Mesorhizobium sp. CAU 1732]|uniref:hypothetical protein n=1 Tax=Mesorhizobium sp. CAU 1732 TaxID=3140358 RepID=UPI003261ADBB
MSLGAEDSDIEPVNSLSSYRRMSQEERSALIDPVFDAIARNRRADVIESARQKFHTRFEKLEEKILSHFQAFVGGPGYMSQAEAWTQACRQREFVREVCARMAEGEGGEPTGLSEAIRDINISEEIRVIPDYSKGGTLNG